MSENLKFDYLKNEKSFLSELKNIFLVSQVQNVVDTTFKVRNAGFPLKVVNLPFWNIVIAL